MINEGMVREALREVVDPEIGLDIVTLGLVYGITVSDEGDVAIEMTLTTQGCPMEAVIMSGVEHVLSRLEGVGKTSVSLVWEPHWSPDKIDKEASALMGF
ncbi:MAG TPA: iron-sulfur cluster assembly protein, partial [Pantanalinema sp.]